MCVSSSQESLLQGDALSQHRFVVQSILSEALEIVRKAAGHSPAELERILAVQLTIVRECADELRHVGCPTEDLPF